MKTIFLLFLSALTIVFVIAIFSIEDSPYKEVIRINDCSRNNQLDFLDERQNEIVYYYCE